MHCVSPVQVIQDLHEECGKYGQLLHVIVPRPPNPASAMELFGSNNYGKVGFFCVRCIPPFPKKCQACRAFNAPGSSDASQDAMLP